MKDAMKRRKRFRSEPREKYIELTERDELILKALWTHRFLTSRQIERLSQSKSRQHLQRRLRRLFDHRYVDRPTAQIAGGNAPMVYGLGDVGVRHLKERHGIELKSIGRWREKNAQAGRYFLDHTVDTAEQLITFELACRNHPGARYLSTDFILEKGGSQTGRGSHPLSMKTTIDWDSQIYALSVIPDGLFGVYFEDASDRDRVQFFMLELDEGTMPVVSRNYRASSILKKMKAYASVIRNRTHKKRFSIEAFRVLWVTTSNERATNMQTAYETYIKRLIQPGFFIFATKAQLAGTNPLGLETVLQTASGKPFYFDPANRAQADAA